MTRLAEMFNVNHFIVSQVNPHVVPFLTSEEYVSRSGSGGQDDTAVAAGSGWLHTMASFAKTEAMHRMHVLAELGVFPNYFTKIRSVLSQKYSGDITILPEVSFAQFPLVLQNPTAEFMVAAMMAGERATWPKLSRIQNHCAIELALDRAVQKLRARMVFSPSQVDLRMMSLRPLQRKIAHFGEGSGAGRVPLKRSITSSGPQFVDKRTARPKFELRPSKRSNQKLNRSSSQVGTNSGIQYSSDSDSEAEDPDASYINLTLPRKRKGRQPDSDSDDSVPFNPRSYSPSPEPGSSNVHLAPAPKMWPSPQHIFPSKSQPAIPSQMSPRTREFAHSSTINLPGRWPSSHAMDSATAQLTMTPLMPSVSGRRNHADSSTSTAGSTSGTRRSAISRRKSSRSLG